MLAVLNYQRAAFKLHVQGLQCPNLMEADLKSLTEATAEGRMKEAVQTGWQAAENPSAYLHVLQS